MPIALQTFGICTHFKALRSIYFSVKFVKFLECLRSQSDSFNSRFNFIMTREEIQDNILFWSHFTKLVSKFILWKVAILAIIAVTIKRALERKNKPVQTINGVANMRNFRCGCMWCKEAKCRQKNILRKKIVTRQEAYFLPLAGCRQTALWNACILLSHASLRLQLQRVWL